MKNIINKIQGTGFKFVLILLVMFFVTMSVYAETPTEILQGKINAGGEVSLDADIDLDTTLNVLNGKIVTLDLNGHVLNAGGKSMVINNAGTLTIKDSNPTSTHTQTDVKGIQGGILTGGNNVSITAKGGGIYNTGTLTITGGTIYKNTANWGGGGIYNEGNLTITGGTILENKAQCYGGGVFTEAKGSCTVGGTVRIVCNSLSSGSTSNVHEQNDSGNIALVTISTETPLETGAYIGITYYSTSLPYKLSNNGTADDVKYFFADNSSKCIKYNETNSYLEIDNGGVSVTGVTLDKTTSNLSVGQTVTLSATVTPTDATNKVVIWTSSDCSVATVDNNGLVTAVKTGTVTITVKTTDGCKTATCSVTVVPHNWTYTVDEATKSIKATCSHCTETRTVYLAPEYFTELTVDVADAEAEKSVIWSTDKPGVANVDEDGKVTAAGAGTAKITAVTAVDSSVKGSISINVTAE